MHRLSERERERLGIEPETDEASVYSFPPPLLSGSGIKLLSVQMGRFWPQ